MHLVTVKLTPNLTIIIIVMCSASLLVYISEGPVKELPHIIFECCFFTLVLYSHVVACFLHNPYVYCCGGIRVFKFQHSHFLSVL